MSEVRPVPKQRHPALDLLARYGVVFRAAWKNRAELAGPRRLADEAAFLPAALSLQETPVHPAPRRLAWLIMVLFLLALAWVNLGSIDIVAVAPGRIIVSERTKVVQPFERSVVRRIFVKDGDRVEAGQILVELDPTAAQADVSSLTESGRAAQSEVLRARALLSLLTNKTRTASTVTLDTRDFPTEWSAQARSEAQAQLVAEWNDISARLARLDAECQRRKAEQATVRASVSKIEATLPIARQREQDFQALTAQGFVSGHANQDRTRERIELERDLATQHARLFEAQASLQEAQHARLAYVAETRRMWSERQAQAELKRHQHEQELAKVIQRESLSLLKSPVAGTVQQLALHTEGGVVTEAQPLMVIVPERAELSAEVMLENKDIGFVVPGQAVAIKLETFPFTRYGVIDATVQKVTQDAVVDEKLGALFPAVLSLQRTHINVDGTAMRLAPGMNVIAEIKTGKRRIIDFLMDSLRKVGGESLKER